MKKTLLWALSFFIAVFFAIFQRMTGPTYPLKGFAELGGKEITYRLIRSCETGRECRALNAKFGTATGNVLWRRYRTDDKWSARPFSCSGGYCGAALPSQPPAGKVEYYIELDGPAGPVRLGELPVVARFRGAVPGWILVPHIILMLLFMLFSTRIFLTVFTGDIVIKHAVAMNFAFLLLGGFVFGPLTQYHAFGQYWTGWPLGHDLTDTKILPMLAFWSAALWAAFKAKNPRPWFIAAFIVTALVYFVPHSMFGSELDYSTGAVVTGR